MTGNAIEKTGDKKPSVRQLIEQMTPEIKRALPAHLDAERVARIAITLIGTSPGLQQCTPESFLGALMTASQLGLEPGPLGEAYLVPYGKQVTFIPGYKGLIKLAYQSGQLRRIAAHVIREHDEFDYAQGLDPYLVHKPKLAKRGEPIGVYAVAVLATGEKSFVVLSVDQVEAIRRRSRASKNGPWVTDWDAMARKTAIRQLARWLPMSTDLREFGLAVALDGSQRDEGHRPEIRHVDQVPPVEDPLELEAPPSQLDAEQVRAAATAAVRTQPAAEEDPELDALELARWHEDGHPHDGPPPFNRHAWDPECPRCAGDQVSLAGQQHYYDHTMDWVDGCALCEREKAWKDEDGAGG
jgi:recombination protein RecT